MSNDSARFPDFLIVGAAKSGTSSLHNYLNRHPDIFMPKPKELYFWHINSNPNKSFIDVIGKKAVKADLKSYLDCFSDASANQVIGEACPSYLYYGKHVLENLKRYHPNCQNVKIIIILRHPVDRIISEYNFVCKNGLDPDNLSFKDSLAQESKRILENKLLPDLFYKDVSSYSRQVKIFLENFSHVYIGLYDDLKSNPEKLMNELFNFIGVDSLKYHFGSFEKFNASTNARRAKSILIVSFIRNLVKPFYGRLPAKIRMAIKRKGEDILTRPIVIPNEIVTRLHNDFASEICTLEKIIKKDLATWKVLKTPSPISDRFLEANIQK